MSSDISGEVERTVRAFVERKQRGSAALDSGRRLITDGVLDSIDVYELVARLEGHLGIRITDSDVSVDNFDTVEGIVALCARSAPRDAGET